jgi:hypothetical protein
MTIPLSSIKPDDRMILGLSGTSVSVKSLKWTYERIERKLVQTRLQAVPHIGNQHVLSRLEKKIDAYEKALTAIHGLIYPSIIGGTFGDDGVETRGEEMGLYPCRTPACDELVTRNEVFNYAGHCPDCWERMPRERTTAP